MAEVTREDREIAACAIGEVPWAHSSCVRAWVDSGEDMPGDDCGGRDFVAQDNAEVFYFVADAIAAAREQGAAQERERIAKEREMRLGDAEGALSGSSAAEACRLAGGARALDKLAAWIRKGKAGEDV